MKLLRLKITDPKGFRGLPCGFEQHFRTEWTQQEVQAQHDGFSPFICAGRNGSGKSNLLQVLAAIFYHLECIYLNYKPDSFDYDDETNPKGFQGQITQPDAFELVYEFNQVEKDFYRPAIAGLGQAGRTFAGATQLKDRISILKISVEKKIGEVPVFTQVEMETGHSQVLVERQKIREILPDYVLGYSSGENEILSLPFFKLRFLQFDEYWQVLKDQLPYSGRPESRLFYLDQGFSQAILLCNLLFQDPAILLPFRDDVGIGELKEFRIILRRSITVSFEMAESFGMNNPALRVDPDSGKYFVNLVHLLEANEKLQESLKSRPEQSTTKYQNFDPSITRLKRCATLSYEDNNTDTLILDFCVNEQTRKAFAANFADALELFQAFQVLLTLNLYPVGDELKADLYQSTSPYVGETVPSLASDQRVMRFKNFYCTKKQVEGPLLLKELSDGEYQLLHSLGLCLLFRNTNSLFLLDEPETHFNPDWRSKFISRLRQYFQVTDGFEPEMLITTHSPFLISDSKADKVLVFKKDDQTGNVSVSHPEYNTLGASINKITMATFDKRETIGAHAQAVMEGLRARFEKGTEDKESLITEIHQKLGDSVEKLLLINAILESMKEPD